MHGLLNELKEINDRLGEIQSTIDEMKDLIDTVNDIKKKFDVIDKHYAFNGTKKRNKTGLDIEKIWLNAKYGKKKSDGIQSTYIK